MRSLVAAITIALLSWGCDGSDSQTRYFSIADDSRCGAVRLDVDLSSGSWSPRCELTDEAEQAGCDAEIAARSGRIEAVIRGCDALEGNAVLACSFGGGAPDEDDLLVRSTTTCACDCGAACKDRASICVADSALAFCASAAARQTAAPSDVARAGVGADDCSVTIGMTSTELTGALQIRVDSLHRLVFFRYWLPEGQCESLVPSAISSIHATDHYVEAGFLAVDGIRGPIPLLRCPVDAWRGVPGADAFRVTVIDATDPSQTPIDATAAILDAGCAPPPEVTTCHATFGLTSDETARELQLRVGSLDENFTFLGSFQSARCRKLADQGAAAFFLWADRMLEANFVFESGITGPGELFDCDVRAIGRHDASEFENLFDVTIRGAWDLDRIPISATVEQTGVEDCEVSILTTTTMVTSTTHHSWSTTTTNTTVTSTTEEPSETRVVLTATSSTRIEALDLRLSLPPGSEGRLLECSGSDGAAVTVAGKGRRATVCLYRAGGVVLDGRPLATCTVSGSEDGAALQVELRRALDVALDPASATFELRPQ